VRGFLAGRLAIASPDHLPRTQLTRPFTLLPSYADAAGADMIAESYLPDARNHNGENTGLEPVWSFDPIQAARLGMKRSGIAQPLKFRNPWPGQAVDVVSGKTGAKLVEGSVGPIIAFKAAVGTNHLVERQASPISTQPFAPVTGAPAT
jgi:hypothetical protein